MQRSISHALSLTLLLACGNPPTGGPGEPCRDDGSCVVPYVCVDDVCVSPGDDAGVPDAGEPTPDAAAPTDAGADAGLTCGDGVLGPTETCDPAIADGEPGACPSCDDGIACTADAILGGPCDGLCEHALVTACVSGDGCCAIGCTSADDDDCPALEPAVQLGTTNLNDAPFVGMGGAVTSVAWPASDGRSQGVAVRHVDGSGWGVPVVVAGGVASNDVYQPSSTVVDPAGNATVLGQGTEVGDILRVSRAVRGEPGAAWSTAESIGPEYGSVSTDPLVPVIGVARDGLTVAFWLEDADVVAVEHTDGAWGTPTRRGGTVPEPGVAPSVTRLDDDSAMIAWANRYEVWAARYVYGAGIATATQLTTDGDDIEDQLVSVSADGRGGAAAAWVELYAEGLQVMVARYAAGAWTAAEIAHTSDFGAGHAADARAIAGPGGRVVVTWRQDFGLWSSERVGDSWTAPVRVDDGAAMVDSYDVAIDDAGDAYVVWERRESPVRTEGVSLAVHRPAIGWTAPTAIMPPRSVTNWFGLHPRVATSRGVTTVVWSRDEPGDRTVWARRLR